MEENKDNLGWLIRENTNVIRGPFRHGEILHLLKKGQLKGKTEIARANAYWFNVDEKAELGRFFPELGIGTPAPQEPQTQMTATLTQADLEENRVDVTQMTPSPPAAEPEAPANKITHEAGMQWLSDEAAEEFGDYAGLDLGEPTAVTEIGIPEEERDGRGDPRKRATVKADTLPSEHKDFQGDRPKPITSLMRGPAAPGGPNQPSTMVHVPMNVPDPHVLILNDKEEFARANRNKFIFTIVALVFFSSIAAAIFLSTRKSAPKPRPAVVKNSASQLKPEEALKRALVIFDLEQAKAAAASAEQDPEVRDLPSLVIGEAVMSKEFLYDPETAILRLQTLRPNLRDPHAANEIDNLIGIYSFERDPNNAIETFRRLSASSSNTAARYNLALALLRSGNAAEAVQVAAPLLSSLSEDDPLAAETGVVLGWAQETEARPGDSAAESSFLRALTAYPSSPAARLGLAIHRLRKSGFRASEADFKAFVDLAPDLDPPSRVKNFRIMPNADFYNFARTRIRELNLDGPMSSKPAPLIMAVDAILSCLQNRTAEAGKILEGALSTAPGDVNLIKAVGYHRWKEGSYPAIVDVFRDVPKEKSGFAVPYILGRTYLKLEKPDLAQKLFEQIISSQPQKSEGWSAMGELLAAQGKNSEAKNKFFLALQKDPMNLSALRGLDRLGQNEGFNSEVMENLPF